jgi:uncharacterized protein YwqG/tetratricopeptide (TPR) repeat protein
MKKKTAIIILSITLAVLVVSFCYDTYTKKEISFKLLASIALNISVIIRLCRGEISASFKQKAVYASTYKNLLRNAFSSPGDKKYYNQLLTAIDIYNKDKYEDAIKKLIPLLRVCKCREDSTAVFIFIALSYEGAGATEKAIDAYTELLRYDNECSTAWSNLGLLYRKQGKHRDAIGCYLNAIKYDEHNAYAYNNLASSLFAIGDYRSAIEHAKTALEKKKDLYQAASMLSLAYLLLGDREESEKYYDLAIINGEKKEKLDERIKDLSEHGVYEADIMPIPEEVDKARATFSRASSVPFVQMCLPADGGVKSHVGGALGEAPMDSEGKPMRLICAVYCDEVNGVPDFPKSGVLRFYIADNVSLGADRSAPTVQKDFRVIYSESEDFGEVESPVPASETFPVKGEYGVIFRPGFCPITYSDYRFEAEFSAHLEKHGAPAFSELDEDVHFQLHRDYQGAGHRIGGFPCFCEEDPRKKDENLRKYDTLLLQVVSHTGYIDIYNDGVMSFFIPHEKLIARDFSDILYWWDEEDD